jgi:hypothetical protein
VFCVTVDGVHCTTYECRKAPSAKWYSHKSHGPGLAYKIGISIWQNRVVWTTGSYAASTNDITMFREGGLKDQLENAGKVKRGLGDSIYASEPGVMSTKNSLDDKREN